MKIISKYKDYYDYLSGIYGEDEKLILDRRDSESYILPTLGKLSLYIAGYVIEGLVRLTNEGKYIFYYGESLKPFIVDKSKERHWWLKWSWLNKHNKRDYDKSYHIKYRNHEDWYYLEPQKDLENLNEINDYPILMKNYDGTLKKYPKLSDFNLAKFIKPDTIYQWLSTWLSDQITNKEKQINEIPDSLKIQNKGFDNKKSFRPKMK